MTYEAFWKPLTAIYETGEAKAIARLVAEVRCGLSLADLMVGKELTEVEGIHKRLLAGEPVQYVLGQAEFCGRLFHVGPGVLIPRPETEELCRWVMDEGLKVEGGGWKVEGGRRILDIGTGSGCIAITLAAELPEAEVEAWDISDDALRIAQENANNLCIKVKFEKQDILNTPPSLWRGTGGGFSLIISNPPYICENESEDMKPWVLDHEPKEALFVPDSDPLLFYRHIANYALATLEDEGRLYFEINPCYCKELELLLADMGFKDIQVRKDQFDKQRFIRACK